MVHTHKKRMDQQQKAIESIGRRYCYFWQPHATNGCLSNWSEHSINCDDKIYKTAEHLFMYRKAMLMGDKFAANRILLAKTPHQVKAIGRSVTNWDETKWRELREKIMFDVLLLKANQHTEVRDRLIETAGAIIAEASPYDMIWGIGCTEDDVAAREAENWKGLNLLGKAWMKVRELILLES